MTGASELENVLRYHERTKHYFNRFAAGPGRLDWANQPDPFRRYAGAALVRLPLLAPDEEPVSPAYEDLFTPGAVRAAPLTLRSLSRLFEYSLALSAWKQAGATRCALRSNPRAAICIPPRVTCSSAESPSAARCRAFSTTRRSSTASSAAPTVALSQTQCWWACRRFTGARCGSTASAPGVTGSTTVLDEVADETIEALLGLDREADFEGAERESAELLMAIGPGALVKTTLDVEAVRKLKASRWYGSANRLSPDDPIRYEASDRVAAASRKP